MTKSTDLWNILVLCLILFGGIYAFMSLQGNQTGQFLIGTVTTAAYIAWGFLHHWLRNDLHHKVVIEYVLIGSIALAILFIILHP